MTPSHPSPDGQAGFTIIETMVASVLLLVGLVATLTVLTQASATTVKTRTREQATNLQRELVEAARSVSYDKLTPNGLGTAVRTRPGLGDSSVGSTGWTVRRRNAGYTISMGVCTVDDPRDGTGAHEAGVFCAASGPPPTPDQCKSLIDASALGTLPGVGAGAGVNLGHCGIDVDLDGTVDGLVSTSATVCLGAACSSPPDANPADYKRIVALVRWPGGYNLQTSQVNNPGLAAAPAVTSLTPATATVVDARSSLTLASTTTNSPSTVALYQDGTAIGTASPTGGANWTATWNLGAVPLVGAQPGTTDVVDGSYELSEKAFDRYGQYGATRSQTIVVNRREHLVPARVEAGRNGDGAVEIEWSAAKERDSEGFRVDRKVNGSGTWEEVCARAVRTACRDSGAPASTLLQSRSYTYSVVGYDRDAAGALRVGDRSEQVVVSDPAPVAPGTPTSLQAALVDGNVVLTWTAPAPGLLRPQPDHYNIYRVAQGAGGPDYRDRLDSAYFEAGQPLRYTDTRANGVAHDYWITAVNSQLGESAELGKVTR